MRTHPHTCLPTCLLCFPPFFHRIWVWLSSTHLFFKVFSRTNRYFIFLSPFVLCPSVFIIGLAFLLFRVFNVHWFNVFTLKMNLFIVFESFVRSTTGSTINKSDKWSNIDILNFVFCDLYLSRFFFSSNLFWWNCFEKYFNPLNFTSFFPLKFNVLMYLIVILSILHEYLHFCQVKGKQYIAFKFLSE